MKTHQSNKLSPGEITKLKHFIQSYRKAEDDIRNLEIRFQDLEKTKGLILEEIQTISSHIESLRIDEKKFTDMLITKYGEFQLNLETFEYQLS